MQTQEAILRAAAELVIERGPRDMTVEAVAERAGASKATIYRWWDSKEALILDAYQAMLDAASANGSDTGSLAGDLLARTRARLALYTQQPAAVRTMAELLAAAHDDPAFADAYGRRVVDTLRANSRAVFTRAITRGEIAPDTDVEAALDLLYGALSHRVLHRHATVDDRFAQTIVALVCRAIGVETADLPHVPRHPIRLAGATLHAQRHICAFYAGEADAHRTLDAFVKEGLERGEKAYHIVDPAQRAGYVRQLEAAGIDVSAAEQRGQFELRVWEDAYLRPGHFDQDAMLALVDEILSSGQAQGYPLTRVIARMEWALGDWPGCEQLIEYESRLSYTLPTHRDVVICMYDTTRFPAPILLDALRTHPLALIDGHLHPNPFYVPPDRFLNELRARPTATAAP